MDLCEVTPVGPIDRGFTTVDDGATLTDTITVTLTDTKTHGARSL
jgi:hypothetical protein